MLSWRCFHDLSGNRFGLSHYKGSPCHRLQYMLPILYCLQHSIFYQPSEKAYKNVLANAGIAEEDVNSVYATGYGRNSIKFANRAISEITAHAMGVYHLYPDVNGIIDIGGQDSKVISVNGGKVTDFLMNDKCAAGTGKFLEYTARALEVPIEEFGLLALAQKNQPA